MKPLRDIIGTGSCARRCVLEVQRQRAVVVVSQVIARADRELVQCIRHKPPAVDDLAELGPVGLDQLECDLRQVLECVLHWRAEDQSDDSSDLPRRRNSRVTPKPTAAAAAIRLINTALLSIQAIPTPLSSRNRPNRAILQSR